MTTDVPTGVDRYQLHPVVAGLDPEADAISLATARSLMRAETREDAAGLLRVAVAALGGEVVPAWEGRRDALSPDVSLGVGEPAVAVPTSERSRPRLTFALPAIVEDALTTAARCDSHAQQARQASVDALTGVANRREILPRLRGARPGDVVCILDLDRFKEINDLHGHAAGDEALRCLGTMLREGTRAGDFVGRYGGDEFVIVMPATRLPVAVRRVRSLAREVSRRDDRVSISGGIAYVDDAGGLEAIDEADRALYRAKQRGRGRIEAADGSRGDLV